MCWSCRRCPGLGYTYDTPDRPYVAGVPGAGIAKAAGRLRVAIVSRTGITDAGTIGGIQARFGRRQLLPGFAANIFCDTADHRTCFNMAVAQKRTRGQFFGAVKRV